MERVLRFFFHLTITNVQLFNASLEFVMRLNRIDDRKVDFKDGSTFSRFLKQERINNQTFIAFLNLTLTLTLKLTSIWECYKCLVDSFWFKNLEKLLPSSKSTSRLCHLAMTDNFEIIKVTMLPQKFL